ncbi:MAG: HEAT repeat domain-containing protein [Deltaproteobacteria bacterium]|nr:HEAT repeat domain-containing protein [Deltaproteobacteria bacterium]MCB9785426.1 HEAT repeat domain-containing protein [Deltaproteobacteria bacterium]
MTAAPTSPPLRARGQSLARPAALGLLALAALALASTLGASPASAAERSREDVRRSLIAWLESDEFRVERKSLEGLGAEVNKLLVDIAGDPGQEATTRQRAVGALAVFPSTRSRQFLAGVVFERSFIGTPLGTLLRREALRSLARAFRESAVHTLASVRDDPNPQIREACARALGDTGSDTALVELDAWLPNEPQLFVRVAIDEAIDAIRRNRSR